MLMFFALCVTKLQRRLSMLYETALSLSQSSCRLVEIGWIIPSLQGTSMTSFPLMVKLVS